MNVIVSVRSGDNDQREQDEIVDEMIDAGCDVLCVNLVEMCIRDRLYPTSEDNLREMDDELARLTLIEASLMQQQKADVYKRQ